MEHIPFHVVLKVVCRAEFRDWETVGQMLLE